MRKSTARKTRSEVVSSKCSTVSTSVSSMSSTSHHVINGCGNMDASIRSRMQVVHFLEVEEDLLFRDDPKVCYLYPSLIFNHDS